MSHCLDNLLVYQSPSLTAVLVESRAPIGVQTSANGASTVVRPEHREKEACGEIYGLHLVNARFFTAEQHVNQTLAGYKFSVSMVLVSLTLDLAAQAQTDIILKKI